MTGRFFAHTAGMKKAVIPILIVFALCLSGCDFDERSTLRDISKPYAAEYRCRKLLLGGEDELPSFSVLKLTLGYYGAFTLAYESADGNRGEYTGTYTVDGESGTVTFAAGEGKRYRFPFRGGTVYIELPLGEKLLHAEFSALS